MQCLLRTGYLKEQMEPEGREPKTPLLCSAHCIKCILDLHFALTLFGLLWTVEHFCKCIIKILQRGCWFISSRKGNWDQSDIQCGLSTVSLKLSCIASHVQCKSYIFDIFTYICNVTNQTALFVLLGGRLLSKRFALFIFDAMINKSSPLPPLSLTHTQVNMLLYSWCFSEPSQVATVPKPNITMIIL